MSSTSMERIDGTPYTPSYEHGASPDPSRSSHCEQKYRELKRCFNRSNIDDIKMDDDSDTTTTAISLA